MTCPATASSLGAYVLGALDPEERRLFEEHLDHCALCAAELAEFADIPALLDRVRPEDLQPVAVTPSPELYERVSAAARATPERVPRSRRWLLVAAAVLVLLGAGTGVIVWANSGGNDTVTASSGPVHVTMTATGQDEGTALDVTVAGLGPGEICRLVVVDAEGEHHPAGEWNVSEEGGGQWHSWADVPRDDLRAVVMYGEGDREVVRVEL
jgi:predicted anti-sigma-YlaC factor YlaD